MSFGLAIETSGRDGSLALTQDDQVIATASFEQGIRHAAELLPRVDQLLKQHQLVPKDLRTLYVSIGPGSFTGLRIGVTFAKALAWTTGARLVAVHSLQVTVQNLPSGPREAMVILDARRGMIFTARFLRQADGQPWQVCEPAHLDRLEDALSRAGRPVHLLGEGLRVYRRAVPDHPDVHVADESLWQPKAEALARLGFEQAHAGRFIPPSQLVPLYVRRPEAEEKWDAEHRPSSGGTGEGG